jgi:hypothetical protein
MLHCIKLEKEDIRTAQFYENIKIMVSPDFEIILSKEAAEELKNDIITLSELWENPHVASSEEISHQDLDNSEGDGI